MTRPTLAGLQAYQADQGSGPRRTPIAARSADGRYLRIPPIGSAPGGNSFTALLFGRLYERRIKLYRGIHLRRAVPSFTVELRRRPRLATNSSQNPRLSETKILQAPFERGSHRVAAAAFEANASTSPANVARRSQRVEFFSVLSLTRLHAVSPEKPCSHPHRRI